ncbi:MAG: YkgJ family cysteine cluster protein [Pseudomonadales bacterium]
MACRAGCGACCIAPSITSAIPGMPQGKPAGVRCVQLDMNNLCMLFGSAQRPAVCSRFTASPALCGNNARQAYRRLAHAERCTRPAGKGSGAVFNINAR